eukprot:gnl/TRDRNA2_/TRDRNA2_138289_c0_seq2.p1 gnl/TRDRNA2_/TRDRNA2_138289_c0~~gnl/TRDRNA2_/TRDRNA2_138289_c0_seq2.p1  ORF type:complete len:140 (-),score=9.04 gnl/TRDRNA2_/TRDRNA2_138289_c0_seq2:99-518(-)
MEDFSLVGLPNLACVFARMGMRVPMLLEPTSVLDAIEWRQITPRVVEYQMLMECCAASGQIVAGFALLARAEVRGVLSNPHASWYQTFRSLLETCRVFDDPDGASRVQAMVERFGSIALATVARTLVLGAEHRIIGTSC